MRPRKEKNLARWRSKKLDLLIVTTSVAVLAGFGFLLRSPESESQTREIAILARSYAFEPPVLRVNRGDEIRIRFASLDVVHGFYLEGYDLDVEIQPMKSQVEVRRPSTGEKTIADEVVFLADKSGKFKYRCSKTCGFMHPFMQGELVVAPNSLFPAGAGASLGLLLGSFLVALREARAAGTAIDSGTAS